RGRRFGRTCSNARPRTARRVGRSRRSRCSSRATTRSQPERSAPPPQGRRRSQEPRENPAALPQSLLSRIVPRSDRGRSPIRRITPSGYLDPSNEGSARVEGHHKRSEAFILRHVTSAAPSLVPARPAAHLDPEVNDLIEKSRGSVSRRLRARGLASARVLGGAFAALLAQFAFDFAFSAGREWFAKGVAPTSQLPYMGWAFLVDSALAPVGLLAALAAVDNRSAVALVLPLVGLLTMFARERQVRIDHALELSHAYRGTAFLLGDVVEADDAYTGSHSRDVVALVRDVCDRLE